ncbi:MAG: 50S ribosomal protein L23 [Candidatus Magasanikbacteria bacterium CG_4_10_14_0_2_um_filter_33_14]|uniref:Large ribosomal subunit protein uL23 n=2 Tax=Candidatus Magasanikiibacteriota TaxID=1752731 RepID=A0A2M7V9I1_9BACT|nr:MAG: 50S ribosomal protein L23 [Candidatus Magasanikbacteria bacterium CG_4_10_14_0_2_um_filter_33_14]
MGLLDKLTKKDTDKSVANKATTVEASKKSSKINDKKESTVKKAASSLKGPAHKIILKPLVSEKASMAEMHGQYTFLVNKSTNKTEIKKAVKQVYGVIPTDVRVMNFEGKRTRFGALKGKRSDFKKAIITLAKGHSINIHEGV